MLNRQAYRICLRNCGLGFLHQQNATSRNDAKAFTLAEVLITLAIIGIIATITIPTLINNAEENQLSAALKETTSILTQAATSLAADNGGEIPYQDSAEQFLTELATKLKTVKKCNMGAVIGKCWEPNIGMEGAITTGSGDAIVPMENVDAYVLANGAVVTMMVTGSGDLDGRGINDYCYAIKTDGSSPDYSIRKYCYMGLLIFDTNGMKGPNKDGRDIHLGAILLNGTVSPALNQDTGSGDSIWGTPCDATTKKTGSFACSAPLYYK